MGDLASGVLAVALALNLALTLFIAFNMKQVMQGTQNQKMLCGVKYVDIALIFLVSFTFFSLIKLFLNADYSLHLVAKHVSNLQPWYYRLGAVWGNHEGSMLMWVWLITVVQALWGFLQLDSPKETLLSRMVMGVVTSAFYIYTLIIADPFAPHYEIVMQGKGLMTLLQDPLLVIHPPILYAGYALTLIPFAQAMALLVQRDKNHTDLLRVIPNISLSALLAWGTLSKGIMLGSYWAYYELGWGGYWFWDPVENASLLPWIALLGLMHVSLLAQRKKSYYVSVLFLSVLVFLMSLLGAFLVRSGILSSVHAFAQDPKRGLYILAVLAGVGGVALLFLMLRSARYFKEKKTLHFFSQDTFWLIGIFCMFATLATIGWGTIYPLILQLFFNKYISVGPPYFERLLAPFTYCAVMMLFLTFIGPRHQTGWAAYKKKLLTWRTWFIVVISAVVMIFSMYLGALWYLAMGISASIFLFLTMIFALVDRGITRRHLGVFIAHGAFAILILGVCMDGAFYDVQSLTFKKGESVSFNGYTVQFEDYILSHGPNYKGIEALFKVRRVGKNKMSYDAGELTPNWRFFHESKMQEHETSQLTIQYVSQLYAAISDLNKEQVTIKLWYRPFILLIWTAAFLMMLSLFFFIRSKNKEEDA